MPGRYSVVLGWRTKPLSKSGVRSLLRSDEAERVSSESVSVAALYSLVDGWNTGKLIRSRVEHMHSFANCW